MSDKNLIDQLVSEHKEIKSAPSVLSRYILWVVVSALCLAAGVSMLGIREDWASIFTSPLLLLQNIIILVGILLAGFIAVKLSIPGDMPKQQPRKFLISFAVVWALILFFIGLINHAGFEQFFKFGFGCILDIIVIGIIPGVALLIFISQGVVLERRLAGVLGMSAAFGVGAYGVQFTCHSDDAIHIFLWHFIPVIILAWCGTLIGKKFINKL